MKRSSSEGQTETVGARRRIQPGGGAWVPWRLVERLCRLELRPPSVQRVLLAIVLTACRYGGWEARLGVDDLAQRTGLSPRTVKSALALLISRGFISRQGRYRRLVVNLLPESEPAGEAPELAPRTCKQPCPSPISIEVSSITSEMKAPSIFSPRQQAVIDGVLTEATELLGSDAGCLILPEDQASQLGLTPGITYQEARRFVAQGGNRRLARDFVKAILSLRHDWRVQGDELQVANAEPDSASHQLDRTRGVKS
jgi:Helix-turn-helix domain